MTAAVRPVRAATFSSASVRLGDERGPQQQVLGRVAGDRELGERDQVAARRVGLLVRVEDPRRRCPSRSPTTRSSWAAATRSRGIAPGYGATVAARHCDTGRRRTPCSTRRRCVEAIERSADPRAARAVLDARRRAHPELADELRDDAPVRDALDRGRVSRRARCRRALDRRRRRCSTRCATDGASRRERTVDGYRRSLAARRRPRRRRRSCAAGSGGSSCASRPATSSASPTCPRSGASSPRSPRCASTRALDIAERRARRSR